MKRSLDIGLDTEPITLFSKNGSSGIKMEIEEGIEVALTLDGLYYTGQVMVERVVSKEPCLLLVWVLEATLNIEMCIPFLENDLKQFC